MKISRRDHLRLLGGTALTAALGGTAIAQGVGTEDDDATPTVHEVQMLNQHPDNPRERQVFYPDIVRARPGDTIRFISADRGHNSQVNEDIMPEGGEMWEGGINDDVEVTLTTEGTYCYYCKPHQTAGMVGLILVGDPSVNYEEAKDSRFRGLAKRRYEDIFARADALLAEEENA